jgi:hypothetical protein
MKKQVSLFIAILLCFTLMVGCGSSGSSTSTPTQSTSVVSEEYTAAYQRLLAYKIPDYLTQTVADFNASLSGENDDFSSLFEDYAIVMNELPKTDENYTFFSVTLACSTTEIYSEHLNDTVFYYSTALREEGLIEPLNSEEEEIMDDEEPIYEFVFHVCYFLFYDILDNTALTVGERDTAISQFCGDFMAYIDAASKEDLCSSDDIKELLAKKTEELTKRLSTEIIVLNCEIEGIFCSDVDSETFYTL